MDQVRRRRFLLATGGALACPALVLAQGLVKPRRVAYLASVNEDGDRPRIAEFRKALAGLGYVEGRNLLMDVRYSGAEQARLPALAAELLRAGPDAFVTVATPATLAAKNVTRSIPIVFSGIGDPVAFGVVDSLRRPGGNVTGIANIVPELAGKRLEFLKETIPTISTVGVTLEPDTPVSVLQWKESQLPARRLALQLHPMQVSGRESYGPAFAEATKAGVSAVAVSLSPTVTSFAAEIVQLAAKFRMPAIYARSYFAEVGGLMAYGASFETDGRVMARLVDRIFKGAKPEDLPVEQPTEFELVINLKTARQLGLTIPQALLLRADRVIE